MDVNDILNPVEEAPRDQCPEQDNPQARRPARSNAARTLDAPELLELQEWLSKQVPSKTPKGHHFKGIIDLNLVIEGRLARPKPKPFEQIRMENSWQCTGPSISASLMYQWHRMLRMKRKGQHDSIQDRKKPRTSKAFTRTTYSPTDLKKLRSYVTAKTETQMSAYQRDYLKTMDEILRRRIDNQSYGAGLFLQTSGSQDHNYKTGSSTCTALG